MKYAIRNVVGFTLYELMISLAIIIITVLISTSFYSNFIQRNILEERLNTLTTAIKFSQNMAIIKQQTLLLKPLSEANGWGKGMQLVCDGTMDNRPLRVWRWPINKPIDIKWQGLHKHGLLFNANLNKSMLSGTFLLQQNKITKKKVIINRLGRVRVEDVA